jgi:hypothetical protein
MVIRTDYILEMIEQATEALLVAAGLQQPEQTEAELADAVAAWTGLNLDLAEKLPAPALTQLLGAGPMGAGERMVLVGQALAVRCLIARQRDDALTAQRLSENARHLIQEGLKLQPDLDSPGLQAVISLIQA